jgi:hypothetical protein
MIQAGGGTPPEGSGFARVTIGGSLREAWGGDVRGAVNGAGKFFLMNAGILMMPGHTIRWKISIWILR